MANEAVVLAEQPVGDERDGLGAGRGTKIDLGAGGGDDLAITDDPWVGRVDG